MTRHRTNHTNATKSFILSLALAVILVLALSVVRTELEQVHLALAALVYLAGRTTYQLWKGSLDGTQFLETVLLSVGVVLVGSYIL